MSYPAIEAKGVRFSYGKNEILHGVDFAAQKGQLIAVLGPNGAGKSTLFRCLLGLYHSYQGVFQNPMAAPDLLGASTGACFGAALAILHGRSSAMITLYAFFFSALIL